jgi:ABC-type amino acid transport substrate-binding protein
MKKILTLIVTALLLVTACFGLTACGETQQLKFGKELVKLDAQLDTLSSLQKEEIDVSVIDSVMAGYYTTQGAYKDDIMIIEDLVLAQEEYGIAAKKGNNALMSKINQALIAIQNDGYAEVAEQFGLSLSKAISSASVDPYAGATDGSWDAIVNSGTLVIGYTVFAPIAYFEGQEFTGFDAELAKKVVAYINEQDGTNIQIDFQEIDWDSKESLLANGTIDLVWNGMTITPERSSEMCISIPYLYNNQVAVIRKADAAKYDTAAELVINLNQAVIGVESGSAGEGVVVK